MQNNYEILNIKFISENLFCGRKYMEAHFHLMWWREKNTL